MASFPSWLGRIPAAALVIFSLPSGILSFAGHTAMAAAVFAGHRFMLDGRVIGGALQLVGIGGLLIEFLLSMQRIRDLAYAGSPFRAPSTSRLWWFGAVVFAFLLWGLIETIRCQKIAAQHPLAVSSSSGARPRLGLRRAIKSPNRTRAFLAAACGILLFASGLSLAVFVLSQLEELMTKYSARVLWLATVLFVILLHQAGKWGQRLIFRARRLLAPTVEDLLKVDRRPTSLLLRSFKDDLTPLAPEYHLGREYATRVMIRTPEQLTLEEVIEDVLSAFGPLIAIGRPGEQLPPVGAARTYLERVRWQDSVSQHMRQAQWIVVVLGRTAGLAEEYSALRELDQLSKVVVVFPPVAPADLQMRWQTFAENALATVPFGDLTDALVAVFPDGHRPTFLLCRDRDQQCYELALRRALALQSAAGATPHGSV